MAATAAAIKQKSNQSQTNPVSKEEQYQRDFNVAMMAGETSHYMQQKLTAAQSALRGLRGLADKGRNDLSLLISKKEKEILDLETHLSFSEGVFHESRSWLLDEYPQGSKTSGGLSFSAVAASLTTSSSASAATAATSASTAASDNAAIVGSSASVQQTTSPKSASKCNQSFTLFNSLMCWRTKRPTNF